MADSESRLGSEGEEELPREVDGKVLVFSLWWVAALEWVARLDIPPPPPGSVGEEDLGDPYRALQEHSLYINMLHIVVHDHVIEGDACSCSLSKLTTTTTTNI